MRYFEEVDVADDASSQGLSSYEAYPAWCWGTVLNLRHQETMTLLENCNELARKGKFEFDSISVGFNLRCALCVNMFLQPFRNKTHKT
jgi:hypothetical protein